MQNKRYPSSSAELTIAWKTLSFCAVAMWLAAGFISSIFLLLGPYHVNSQLYSGKNFDSRSDPRKYTIIIRKSCDSLTFDQPAVRKTQVNID